MWATLLQMTLRCDLMQQKKEKSQKKEKQEVEINKFLSHEREEVLLRFLGRHDSLKDEWQPVDSLLFAHSTLCHTVEHFN